MSLNGAVKSALRFGQSNVFRLAFGSSVLRAFGLGITLLTSIALARALGPAGLGHYSFALAVVTVIGLPIHAGLSTLVLRETAKGEASADWSHVRGIWRWSMIRIAAISAIIFCVAAFVLWAFGSEIIPEGGLGTVWLSLALVPLIALAQTRGAAVRGLHRPILGLLPDSIVRPVGLVLLLLIVWASGRALTAQNAMELHIVSAAVAACLAILFLRRLTPKDVRAAQPQQSHTKQWQKSLFPLALLAGIVIVMQNTSLFLLGLWQPPEQVGFFKVAVSASNLLVLGLTAINMVMGPTFVKLYSLGERRSLERKASQSALLAVGAALPPAILLIFFGPQILTLLFGAVFAQSYVPLLILIVGQICSAWFGSCANLLNMSGNEVTSLKVLAGAMALNITLSVILIPQFGLMGSAVATSIATIMWNLAIGIAVRRKLSIASTPLGLLRPMPTG